MSDAMVRLHPTYKRLEREFMEQVRRSGGRSSSVAASSGALRQQ